MSDVVIIGGGAIGMLSARALALRGARVTLLERGQLGAQSSWAGGGILSALVPWQTVAAVNRLILWGHHYYPVLADELKAETAVDVQWCQSGMVVTTSNTEAACAWSAKAGLRAEVLSPDQLVKLLPGVTIEEKMPAAVCLPEVAQIRNPRLIKALELSLRGLGVEIQEACQVGEIVTRGQQVVAVKTAHNTLVTDHVILAAGAWSAQLLPELARKQVQPMRGEMLLYKAQPRLLSRIVVADGGYLIPRQDGHILCGSTVEAVGFDCTTTQAALTQLSACAQSLLPSLEETSIVGHWAGLRPGSHGGVPVISRSSEYHNLYVNCGHFRNGIAMAPASAQIVTDLVEGVEPAIDSADYILD